MCLKKQSCKELSSQPVRSVTAEQQIMILKKLQKYKIHLGCARQRFGGIDQATGFTISLIKSVAQSCEYLSSAEQVSSSFNIWDVSHAHTIMQVIHDVCGH